MTNRIFQFIDYLQITPTEFADNVGISRSAISSIKTGRTQPTIAQLIKIKTSYPKVSLNWLMIGSGNMIEEQTSNSAQQTPIQSQIHDNPIADNNTNQPNSATQTTVQNNMFADMDTSPSFITTPQQLHAETIFTDSEPVLTNQANQNTRPQQQYSVQPPKPTPRPTIGQMLHRLKTTANNYDDYNNDDIAVTASHSHQQFSHSNGDNPSKPSNPQTDSTNVNQQTGNPTTVQQEKSKKVNIASAAQHAVNQPIENIQDSFQQITNDSKTTTDGDSRKIIKIIALYSDGTFLQFSPK